VYTFRLFATGDKAARREKYKEVDEGDLGRLYEGRGAIVRQTSVRDLLVFLGNSGA